MRRRYLFGQPKQIKREQKRPVNRKVKSSREQSQSVRIIGRKRFMYGKKRLISAVAKGLTPSKSTGGLRRDRQPATVKEKKIATKKKPEQIPESGGRTCRVRGNSTWSRGN